MDYGKASSDLRRYLPLKVATMVWFVVVFGSAVYALAATWNEWWPYSVIEVDRLDEAKAAIYSFIAGLLGATVYAFRGFYWAVGPQDATNRKYQYDPNWTWWYIARPIMGAFLGGFSYALLRGGVATFAASATSAGGPQAAYFAVGFLAGFSMTEVLDWTTAAASRIFDAAAFKRDSRTREEEDGTKDEG